MERSQNRNNIDFDSDIEVESLKDAIWRLTTRVYLLEDFIAEKFGEVLTASGFRKSTEPVPDHPESSPSQTSKTFVNSEVSKNVVSESRRGKRKRRRHDEATSSIARKGDNKIQKTLSKTKVNESTNDLCLDPNVATNHPEEFTDINPDPLIVLKDEIILSDCNESDISDDFLNDKSDSEDDANDSVQKDPDFLPSLETRQSTSTARVQNEIQNKITGKDGVKFVKSQNGENKLSFDGYLYSETNTNAKNSVSYWRCEKCPSQAIYTDDSGVEVKKEHNHEPDPASNSATESERKIDSSKKVIIEWNLLKTYDNEEEASLDIKDDWSVRTRNFNQGGKVIYYHCRDNKKCPCRRKLTVDSVISLWENNAAHFHFAKTLTKVTKGEIIKLFQRGIRKPKQMLKHLEGNDTNVPIPTLSQLKNFLQRHKKNTDDNKIMQDMSSYSSVTQFQ